MKIDTEIDTHKHPRPHAVGAEGNAARQQSRFAWCKSIRNLALASVLFASAGQLYVHWINPNQGVRAGASSAWSVVDGPPGMGRTAQMDIGRLKRPPGKELSFRIARTDRSWVMLDWASVAMLAAGGLLSCACSFLSRPRIRGLMPALLAVVVAGFIPPLSSTDSLLASLHRNIRIWVAVRRASADGPKTVDHLLSFAKNGDVSVFDCEDVLRRIGPGAIPPLLRHLRSSDPEARLIAAIGIVRVGPENGGGGIVLLAAIADQSVDVRREMAGSLDVFGAQCKEGVVALLGMMEDPDPLVRAAAVASLLLYDPMEESVIPVLIEKLSDPAAEVRLAAAVGLGVFGASSAVPELRRLCRENPDELVRTCAEQVLHEMQSPRDNSSPR